MSYFSNPTEPSSTVPTSPDPADNHESVYGGYSPYGPSRPSPSSRKAKRGGLATLGGLLLLLLSKLKYLLIVFKMGAFGPTTLTMLISLVIYAGIFGWGYAIGFIALLLVHELGHVLVARMEGLPTSAPVFIPFFGALIMMRQQPRGSVAEAALAAGGPVLGSLGALACLGLYAVTRQPLMLALAYVGFFINLFNLIPMSPLDGGRILGAVSRWAYVIGVPILLFLILTHFNPFLLLIVALGVFDAWQRFRSPLQAWYDSASPVARWTIAFGYLTLVLLLVFGMNSTHALLAGVRGAAGLG
ncbi:MAG: site-2 protease family protein [Chloroflexi bacterium]|nr:site-2 protease family protein [Chloroflexota bacterium]